MKKSLFFALALAAICAMPSCENEPKNTTNGHEWVDLGLPSGTLWATCNVGANAPEEYGYYFAWGETQPKDIYNESNYQHCMGNDSLLTKYNYNSEFGNDGFTDTLTCLLPEDDAATICWGNDWRMPTKEEFEELCKNTTVTWTARNGVNGMQFAANNGNSLFLPAAGAHWDKESYDTGSHGNYWSKSLSNDLQFCSRILAFSLDDYGMYNYFRDNGLSVRPVTSSH